MRNSELKDFNSIRVKILTVVVAERLRRTEQENVFSYCLATDLFEFVLK